MPAVQLLGAKISSHPRRAVVGTLLWLIISTGFTFSATNFTSFNATYGAIRGAVVLMLWFYVSSLAVLVGAELNAGIEHVSPCGKEPGEKEIGEKKKIGALAVVLTYGKLTSCLKRLT